MKKPANV